MAAGAGRKYARAGVVVLDGMRLQVATPIDDNADGGRSTNAEGTGGSDTSGSDTSGSDTGGSDTGGSDTGGSASGGGGGGSSGAYLCSGDYICMTTYA